MNVIERYPHSENGPPTRFLITGTNDPREAASAAGLPRLKEKWQVAGLEFKRTPAGNQFECEVTYRKVPEPPEICAFEGCTERATQLACGRPDLEEEINDEQAAQTINTPDGHPVPAHYCEAHALIIELERNPEYTKTCPNCGCRFGIH